MVSGGVLSPRGLESLTSGTSQKKNRRQIRKRLARIPALLSVPSKWCTSVLVVLLLEESRLNGEGLIDEYTAEALGTAGRLQDRLGAKVKVQNGFHGKLGISLFHLNS